MFIQNTNKYKLVPFLTTTSSKYEQVIHSTCIIIIYSLLSFRPTQLFIADAPNKWLSIFGHTYLLFWNKQTFSNNRLIDLIRLNLCIVGQNLWLNILNNRVETLIFDKILPKLFLLKHGIE